MSPFPTTFHEAAVLVLLHRGAEDSLIFTKRTDKVEHHKGQICFPGGARDGQETLWQTALRETQEEVGLDPARVTFIREMQQYKTPSGFQVTPYIGAVSGPLVWTPNPHEIAEIFQVPLTHLRDPQNFRFETQVWEGQEFINPVFSYKDHLIWGMTGRVVCDFLEMMPELLQHHSPWISKCLV